MNNDLQKAQEKYDRSLQELESTFWRLARIPRRMIFTAALCLVAGLAAIAVVIYVACH